MLKARKDRTAKVSVEVTEETRRGLKMLALNRGETLTSLLLSMIERELAAGGEAGDAVRGAGGS